MPINPLQGGYVPTDTALEHQESTRQDQARQVDKTQQKHDESQINNPANLQIAQQPTETVPVQHSQEAAEANYTDRESQGDGKPDEDENAVEEMEKKTKKSVEDLQKGLQQVADGIEQLKDLSEKESGIPPNLDERLQHISAVGKKLVVDIEKTVEAAVSNMLETGRGFFDVAVAELTDARASLDDFIADMVKRQARIPTPEVRDSSARATSLRGSKQEFGLLLEAVSQSANAMLENAENGLRLLLQGNADIENGFREVNIGDPDGFKKIEAGFRALFDSVNAITDAASLFRVDIEQIFKRIAALPAKLESDLGGRKALGLPEKMAADLWDAPDFIERRWRSIQGNLGRLSAAMADFGASVETNFEQAARAALGDGRIAVDCVNTDLGDIKADAEDALSPSAARAVAQILDGAEQVEAAIDQISDAGDDKHKKIKRGSAAKLPSHFNVRL